MNRFQTEFHSTDKKAHTLRSQVYYGAIAFINKQRRKTNAHFIGKCLWICVDEMRDKEVTSRQWKFYMGFNVSPFSFVMIRVNRYNPFERIIPVDNRAQ